MDQSIITKYRVKKVLKIISIALLFVFLGLLVFEYVRILPQNVQFTNTSSSSVTVSWTTKYPTKGMAVAKSAKNNLPFSLFALGKEIFFDTRDVRDAELLATAKTAENISEEESMGVKISSFVTERVVTDRGNYYTHHVQLTGLDSQTEYKLMIGDGILFKNVKDSDGNSTVQTLEVPESITTPSPAYGSILNANNENLPLEGLIPVGDAIVYFNYLDEATGTKSNTVSSSTTQDGKWYVDISTLQDPEGNNFLEMYDSMDASIWGELTVDAGKLGIWKMESLINEITPFPEVVLNMPDYEEGEGIGILKKISMDNNIFVAKTFAEIRDEDGNLVKPPTTTTTSTTTNTTKDDVKCIFKTYCECIEKVNGVNTKNPCDCNQGTLEARGCATQGTKPQENLTCAGGQPQGSKSYFQSQCYRCGTIEKNNYYIAAWKQDSSLEYKNGSCVAKTSTPPVVATNTGMECDPGSYEVKNNACYQCNAKGNGWTQADVEKCPDLDNPEIVDVSSNDPNPETVCDPEKDGYITKNNRCYECVGNAKGAIWSPTNNTNCPNLNIEKEENEPQKDVTCWTSFATSFYKNQGEATLKCEDGKWVESETKLSEGCIEGGRCLIQIGYAVRCATAENTILTCSFNKWVDKEQTKTRAASNAVRIEGGEKCNNPEGGCLCDSLAHKNQLIKDKEYCKELYDYNCPDLGVSVEGKVCSNNSEKKVCVQGKCVVDDGKVEQSRNMDFDTFVKGVSAAEPQEYIIDTQTGLISGLSAGLYIFENEGETYTFAIEDGDIEENDSSMLIYIDSNANGTYDVGEDRSISDLGSTVNILALKESYNYELTEGYNFISFPFLIDDSESRTAASLLQTLNEVYSNSIYSISKYDGTWKVVGENAENYDNNDFQIVPGQGYILKAKTNVDISIIGQPVELDTADDSAAISLYPGWNLIGTYGSNVKRYTAKSLIQSINAYEPVDFTANNVSRWESDVQRYDGYQLDIENGAEIEYGFDYPINSLQSYFVRITNGRGNWQQEIEE